eukprot:363706-Chlamydomonas_euryale.AAC.2
MPAANRLRRRRRCCFRRLCFRHCGLTQSRPAVSAPSAGPGGSQRCSARSATPPAVARTHAADADAADAATATRPQRLAAGCAPSPRRLGGVSPGVPSPASRVYSFSLASSSRTSKHTGKRTCGRRGWV